MKWICFYTSECKLQFVLNLLITLLHKHFLLCNIQASEIILSNIYIGIVRIIYGAVYFNNSLPWVSFTYTENVKNSNIFFPTVKWHLCNLNIRNGMLSRKSIYRDIAGLSHPLLFCIFHFEMYLKRSFLKIRQFLKRSSPIQRTFLLIWAPIKVFPKVTTLLTSLSLFPPKNTFSFVISFSCIFCLHLKDYYYLKYEIVSSHQ